MRLLLLRHAKSDWVDAEKVDDHDRPLAARGRNAAPLMAGYMHEKGYEPALVLCSSAKRTRQTLKLVLPEFKREPEIHYSRALYLAEWPALLAALHKQQGHTSPLLMVGHNPGLEQLAIALALQVGNAAERARTQSLAQKFPTSALAVLDFDAKAWRDVKPGMGRLVDFMRPKDLPNGKSAKE